MLKKSERWSGMVLGGAPKPQVAPIRAVVGPLSGLEDRLPGSFSTGCNVIGSRP